MNLTFFLASTTLTVPTSQYHDIVERLYEAIPQEPSRYNEFRIIILPPRESKKRKKEKKALIACSSAILVDDPTELGEQLAGEGND